MAILILILILIIIMIMMMIIRAGNPTDDNDDHQNNDDDHHSNDDDHHNNDDDHQNNDEDVQSWEAIPPDTATFTPDISPLVLAAHTDNYEVIIFITIIIIMFMNNIGIIR